MEELKIKELDLNMINPNHFNMNNPEQGGSKIVVIGKPGCFLAGTMIKLWNGSDKPVESITSTDVLVGYDCRPRFINELCRGRENMYRVVYGNDKNDYVVVNENHILTFYDSKSLELMDVVLKDILYSFHTRPIYWVRVNHSSKKWSFLMIRSIEFDSVNDYFGFEIHGRDHHFLLSDGSIVHNTGKCLGRNTEILMHDFSIKKVQDIEVGDLLLGDDLSPRTVLGVASGKDSMYRIRQTFGIHYTVNSEHIICLKPFHDSHSSNVLEIPCKDLFLNHSSLLKEYGGYKIWIDSSLDNACSILSGMQDKKKEKLLRFIKHPYYLSSDNKYISKIWRPSPETAAANHEKYCKPYPISIELLKDENEYFGFEIDGNGRFCLADGTVTHNTTLITYLLYQKRNIIPAAFIMSGTEDSNGHYKTIVPSTFVYNKFHEKKVEDFVMRQKIAKKHLQNPWAVLLMDDCTDDPRIFNKPLFQGLYKNGRHWKMLFILSLQYCMDIKPVIRNNIDGVFILRETNLRNRRSLWENYAGVIPDFSLFCQLMDELTSEYCALYIHNATTSNKLEDCVFWFKAKQIPPNFRFGNKDLWKYHYNRYNRNYIESFCP